MRCAVLRNVAACKTTLPVIMQHARDEREEVRVASLGKLRTEFGLRQLSISQRAWVLEQGLGDRSQPVRLAAVTLLVAWLDECEFSVSTVRERGG